MPLLRGILLRRRSLLAALILLLGSGGTLLGSGALRAVGAGGEPDSQTASDTVVVYGPKRFDAGKGRPALHVERFTVAATPGVRYTLRLVNGAADGSGRVAKATVLLNGAEIFPASELQKTSGALARQVQLQGENTLEITVEGPPASYVTLSVLQAPDPTFTVHGPRTVERGTASPTRLVERFALSATAAPPYALHVTNGAPDGSGRATSASIRINGQAVLSPSDLHPKVSGLIREVDLAPENTVEVELSGEPGARITFRLTATDTTPPLIEIASPQSDLITNALRLEVSGSIRDETHTRVSVNDSTAARSGEGFSATVPLVTEGENPIRIRAVDAAGNRTDSVRVVIRDTEPPVITVSSPLDGALTRDSLVEVSGTIRDMTAVTLNVNGVPVSLDSAGAFHTVLPLVEGANFFTIAATDAAGNSASQTRQVTRDSKPPVITVAEPEEGATTQDSTVRVGGTVEDASPVTLTLNGADVPLSDGAFTTSAALAMGSNALTLTATDAAGNTATVTRTVTRESAGPPLPPDPATVAPQLDRTVATTTYAATSFLYTGESPIQTGVAPGTISPVRVSVLRGKVLTREGQPLSGVTITVLNHSEFGQTLSRADGAFDLAVNGGGLITLNYAKSGYLPVQRQVDAPWQDYVHVEEVALVELDGRVTPVTLSGTETEVQVARGSIVQDADGPRQATVFFKPGTQAEMILPDGTTRPLTTLSVRATELTVGPNGRVAMPGPLPPNVAYTYALDLSVDEARAVGAQHVRFSKPVAFYVDNFLNFPTGAAAPVAWYDFDRAAWVAEDDGVVLKILGTAGGLAELDTDGDGQADSDSTLSALGIDALERQKLAALYPAGRSFWRVQLPHFSVWDINWLIRWFQNFFQEDGRMEPPAPEDGAPEPDPEEPRSEDKDKQDNPNCSRGSIVECENQVLGETIGLSGTPFTLNYRSDRTPGYAAGRTVTIPLSGASVAGSLKQIRLRVEVAGRVHEDTFPPHANQSYTFVWDGKDAYDRPVQGRQPVRVTIGYVYPTYYRVYLRNCQSGVRTWSRYTMPTKRCEYDGSYRRIEAGDEVRVKTRVLEVDGAGAAEAWDSRTLGLGGWTLNVHHSYDPRGKTLRLGNGSQQTTQGINNSIRTSAGTGASCRTPTCGDGGPAAAAQIGARTLAQGPDGSLYAADYGNNRIRKVDPTGVIWTVAGTGRSGNSGDGGPAVEAQLNAPIGLAVGPDGSLYIGDYSYRVRRVSPEGIITTIAGTGSWGYSGDDGPATAAQIGLPTSIAVGADNSVYIADFWNHRIRRVGPDGIITTVAGRGARGYSGDGQYAVQADLSYPWAIALDARGSLYISDRGNSRIRRVSPDGIITTVAGNGLACDNFAVCGGDGLPATQARTSYPHGIKVGPDGSLYLSEAWNNRIRRVGPDGIIRTVAGGVWCAHHIDPLCGDFGPATAAYIDSPQDIAIGTDGVLYVAEMWRRRIRRVSTPLPGVTEKDIVIPSQDGGVLYYFTPDGKHLRTVDALTGAVRYRFDYDSAGRLVRVTDIDGRATIVARDGEGNPVAVVSPDGHRTTVAVDGNGYLASAANPAGETVQFSYAPKGLLTALRDPKGNEHRYVYSEIGRLVRNEDPAGGFKTLARTVGEAGTEVSLSTALGRTTTYGVESLPYGDLRRTTRNASGLSTVTTSASNGTTTIQSPDGTTTKIVIGPDPRFGLQAPHLKSAVVTTPGGLTSAMVAGTRVVLSDLNDPLSVMAVTDSAVLNGRVWRRAYDGTLRQYIASTPEGRQGITRLDSLGRIIEQQTTGLNSIQHSYNSQGQVVRTAQGSRAWSYTYDARGRLSSITDPLSRTERYLYDDADRLERQVLPDGREIGYSYDANGNLSALTPPGRPAHAFGHTPVDLMERYAPPLLGTDSTVTRYSYNQDRQVESVTRPDGTTLNMEYDHAGRLSTLHTPVGQFGYAYHSSTGKLVSVSAPGGGALTYSYDGALPTRVSWSGEVSGTVGMSYNNDFRISALTVNGQDAVAYGYDRDGLLTAAGSLDISRSPQNNLITGTVLGGITERRSYNALGELVGDTVRSGSAPLFATSYTRDALGRITSLTESIGGQTAVYAFDYDSIGRLKEVKRDGVAVESYEYDANGNRTKLVTPNGVLTGSYDAQDRLLQYGGATYSYTANGELQARVVGSDTMRYEYDALGSLRMVILPDGTRVEYLIDGQNRRIGQKVNGIPVRGFLYSGQLNPVAELDGNNQVVSRFVYGSKANVPDYMVKGGVTYRIVSDHLGSVRLVVDVSSGEVVQRIDYDAYGRITQDTNPGFQPFRYAGGLHDGHTSLVRFGARDYDANTGRWTAKDPIGFAGGDANLYAYSLLDPINFVDSDGLCVKVGVRNVGGLGGMAGHAAVRLSWGDQHWSGELLNQDGKNSFNVWYDGAPDPGTYQWVVVPTPSGMTADQFEARVLSEFYRLSRELSGQPYSPHGNRNSNKFINEVITNAGGQIPMDAVPPWQVVPGLCGGKENDPLALGDRCTPL